MKTRNHLKSFKVGSIVLATEQGLGYLAKSFYDNGIITDVYVHPHSSRTNHYEWYPDRLINIDSLLECDVLFFFEEVFNWKLIVRAREKGIKTILMPMYECTRSPLPYSPDLILSPSELDYDYYDRVGERLNVPVDVKWKLREKAITFVHNAGNGGLGGRNGTKELLESMKYVKSPIKLIIRSQVPIKEIKDNRIEYRIGTFNDIWDEGDVFIFPEKFNGLSLPLQEAFASGMLVMAGDRYPINTWLPKEPLIKVDSYKKERLSVSFDSAIYKPTDIAKKIDEWYNRDIRAYSQQGQLFNQYNSWENLKEKYIKVMSQLLEGQDF